MTISYYDNNLYYAILMKAVGFEVFFFLTTITRTTWAVLEFCSLDHLQTCYYQNV